MSLLAHPGLPALACDCHVHVIGSQQSHAMVDERQYTPATASHKQLLRHMQGAAIERVVIVQPSVYGSDNRCMLESLRLLAGAGRGIAVLEEGATPQMLAALDAGGIRGLRINFESAALNDVAALGQRLQYWASRIAPLGWHVQLYASLDTIAAAAPCIEQLEVPVVLDHFAMAPASVDRSDARIQALLALLRSGQAYVKLSAPYRLRGSAQFPANADASASWRPCCSKPMPGRCCGAATGHTPSVTRAKQRTRSALIESSVPIHCWTVSMRGYPPRNCCKRCWWITRSACTGFRLWRLAGRSCAQ